jgi:hypothetical protein
LAFNGGSGKFLFAIHKFVFLNPMRLLLLILSGAALFFFSCRKDSFITSKNAVVNFSSDTLFFDTVFSSTGSITEAVKIYNSNSQKLRLSDVKLMGGSQSFFAINIDGVAGPEQSGLELEAGDSLYIFVAIRINPNTDSLPFIIQDSIQVSFNGNQQYVQLQAWGQNAHFLRNQVIKANTVWNNSLPYVILGGLQVDTNTTLTIQKGCRVYFHADAPLLVDGTLLVTGDKGDSNNVLFLSDRLDDPYRDFPGSWPGIYFRDASVDNSMQFASIRDAYQAVVAEMPATNANPKLVLNQCIIDNSYDAGILGDQSSIRATNCLISNCGKNILLGDGGNYQFTFCTAASYTNNFISHTQPVLAVSNYIIDGSGNISTAPLNAVFTNCIFWGANGTVDNEVVVGESITGNPPFSVNFSNCLWKVKTAPAGITTFNIIANADPMFDSVSAFSNIYDFHLKTGSPAIDKGTASSVNMDLDGNPRPVGLPDLGCYEKQ